MSGHRDVAIDVTRLAKRVADGLLPTGVDRVSLEYISHFLARSLAVIRVRQSLHVLSPGDSDRIFSALLAPEPGFRREFHLLRLRQALMRRLRRVDHPLFLFNTGHSGLELASYADQVGRLPVRPIFFIHDLIPVSYPEYCRPNEGDRHRIRLDNALRMGAGLIVNSDATLSELQAYAAGSGVSCPPAVVARLAPPDMPPPQKRLLSHPYFLMVGTIEPRKNHALILQLWRRVVQSKGHSAPHLVIIGRRGWECEHVVDLLERCEQLRGFVHELPACDDEELATWLASAQALLFPSFVEGYGLPLVEALAVGVPVIASNLPAFRESGGDIPEYLDPLDGPAWMEAILAYMAEDGERRREQLVRLRQFRAATWKDHFHVVESFMASLC